MLLGLNRVSNEHHFSFVNEQADGKAESDSEAVFADILSLSTKWLNWALVTDRVCHQ